MHRIWNLILWKLFHYLFCKSLSLGLVVTLFRKRRKGFSLWGRKNREEIAFPSSFCMSVILLEYGWAPVFQLFITLSKLNGFSEGLHYKKISSTERKTFWLNFKYLFQNMVNILITDKNRFNNFLKNTFYLVVLSCYWEIVNPLWPNSSFLPPKLPVSTIQSLGWMIKSGKVKTAKNKVYGEVSCNINKRQNYQPHL